MVKICVVMMEGLSNVLLGFDNYIFSRSINNNKDEIVHKSETQPIRPSDKHLSIKSNNVFNIKPFYVKRKIPCII